MPRPSAIFSCLVYQIPGRPRPTYYVLFSSLRRLRPPVSLSSPPSFHRAHPAPALFNLLISPFFRPYILPPVPENVLAQGGATCAGKNLKTPWFVCGLFGVLSLFFLFFFLFPFSLFFDPAGYLLCHCLHDVVNSSSTSASLLSFELYSAIALLSIILFWLILFDISILSCGDPPLLPSWFYIFID